MECVVKRGDGGGKKGNVEERELTIRRMLLYDLHSPHDTGLFAVGVVEEGQVTLFHGPEVVTGYVVADT